MRFGPKRAEPDQPSLLGEHDRVEHAPQHSPSPASQRWTTRAQVEQLLAHSRIRELWPTGEYVAADPCAGTGQLMRHLDDVLGAECAPRFWLACELDRALATSPARYQGPVPDIVGAEWVECDSARIRGAWPKLDIVVTNLPWFGVFQRLVGHWRSVVFPNALIVALCDDQERTREPSRRWLADGNMPALIAQIPGRTRFDGADDGQYPFSCSWYIWRPGERRTTSEVIVL